MSSNGKIPHTKSRLLEISAQLSSQKTDGRGITSFEVANEFLKDISSLPEIERNEILKCGLNVLAGRVTVMNRVIPGQYDLLKKEGFPSFVSLRIEWSPGKFRNERFDVRKLTPKQIIMNKPLESKTKGNSKRDNLFEWARKRLDDGFGDIIVELA